MSIRKMTTLNGDDVRWEARSYEGGRGSKRISKRFNRRSDAEAWLREVEQKQLEALKNPFSTLSFEGRNLKEEAEYWLTGGEHRFSPGHLKRVRGVVAEMLVKYGNIRMDKLTPEFITSVQQNEIKAGLTPATANRKTEVLTTILNNSVKHRRIPFSPAIGFQRLAPRSPEMKFWSTEEATSFLTAMNHKYPKGSDKRWVYIVYLVALNTGLRAGEIWGLKPIDVFETKHTIVVSRQLNRVTNSFTQTKSKKPRAVPCNQDLMRELKEWISSKSIPLSATIFQNEKGNPVYHDHFTDRIFFKDLKAWGDRAIRFHDLRHTAITLLIASGVDIKTVKEICGHSDISTTMNYVHMVSGAIEKVAMNFSIMPRESEVQTKENLSI